MDRNAVANIAVSYDEMVPVLTSQIGQLHVELMASKMLIKKLEDIIASLNHSHDDIIDHKKLNDF